MRNFLNPAVLLFFAINSACVEQPTDPLQKAFVYARGMQDPLSKIRLLIEVARALKEANRNQMATECLREAFSTYLRNQRVVLAYRDKAALLDIQFIAASFVSLGERKDAREALEQVISSLSQESNRYTKLSGMIDVAFQYLAIADTAKAIQLANEVLAMHNSSFKTGDLSSTTADDDLLALLIGLDMFEHARRAIDSTSNPSEKVKTLGYTAVRLFERGDTTRAIHYLSEMNTEAKLLQDKPFVIASSMASVSEELFDIGRTTLAIEVLANARRIALDTNDTFSCQEIAAVYAYIGRLDDAMQLVPHSGDTEEQVELLIRLHRLSTRERPLKHE